MFKPLIFYIGLRYTRAKRRTQFISFVTLASVLGIALSVTALITVLSVMNGFVDKISERMLSMTSHATITGLYGQLDDWHALEQQLKTYPHVQGSAPFVTGQVMINADRRVNGTMVSGILPIVGVPLPLISYGGTSMVMLCLSLGILMSIQTHKKLVAT